MGEDGTSVKCGGHIVPLLNELNCLNEHSLNTLNTSCCTDAQGRGV
jgi:hypothetical protein